MNPVLMETLGYPAGKISASVCLGSSVNTRISFQSVHEYNALLNKIQDDRLHMAIHNPMDGCPDECDDLRRCPTIETYVKLSWIGLFTKEIRR
jgi:hypothetical protein